MQAAKQLLEQKLMAAARSHKKKSAHAMRLYRASRNRARGHGPSSASGPRCLYHCLLQAGKLAYMAVSGLRVFLENLNLTVLVIEKLGLMRAVPKHGWPTTCLTSSFFPRSAVLNPLEIGFLYDLV